MALIDEGMLQGNVQQILAFVKKQASCCGNIATAVWAHSSVTGGSVFVTITQGGVVVVYTQPGGTVLSPAQYGTLTST